MWRPRSTLGGKVARLLRVPVAAGKDGYARIGGPRHILVENGDYDVTLWHGQRATGAEIVLYINDDERIGHQCRSFAQDARDVPAICPPSD
jgi:hypothetical protein